jgi:hypothetical protein
MKLITTALWFSLAVSVGPAVAFADDDSILNSSAGARSGADRLGGATMTSPPHAWTATGQSPEALSTDDTRKEQPRNPAVVGPPVPRRATPPTPQAQPATDQPKADQPTDQ